MGALLLTLHLWQAPLRPTPAVQLHLLESPHLAWLAAEPAPVLVPSPAPIDSVSLRLGEIVAGTAAYLITQAVVAGILSGLVLGVDGAGASSPLGIVMILLGVGITGLDLSVGPATFALGAAWADEKLGGPPVSLGKGLLGGYIGGTIGIALELTVLTLEAAFWPASSRTTGGGLNSISPLAYTAIASSILLPLGGGIGASIGQHLGDDDAAPATPGSVPPPPSAIPPDAMPPPQATAVPRTPPMHALNVLVLHFG